MDLKDFLILFPNKIPKGYVPTEIKDNVIICEKLSENIDINTLDFINQ